MAIDIKDLRIGNYVLAGNMWEVQAGRGPYEQSVRTVCLISLDYDDEYDEIVETVQPGRHTNTLDDMCRNIEPIPLTEEWAEKFGFVREVIPDFVDDDGDLIEGYTHLINKQEEFSLNIREGEVVFGQRKIRYVHEVQNLFHAYTGKELQIKEA